MHLSVKYRHDKLILPSPCYYCGRCRYCRHSYYDL